MKKIIITLLIMICALLLSGCTQRTFTPVINTDFNLNAVYKAGDFSYSCKISSSGDIVTIQPTSTKAVDLIIKCDGKKVYFNKDNFSKSFDFGEIDNTNPAKLIYGVFDCLKNEENYEVKRVNDCFQYVGKAPVGNFVLIQNDDNTLKSLTIADANITINFLK